MSHHHLLFKNIHENRVSCRSKCFLYAISIACLLKTITRISRFVIGKDIYILVTLYSIFLFYVLWPWSQIFLKCKILQIDCYYEFGLHYCVHITYLTFEGGSKSANRGPYLLVDFDPRGPYRLVDLDPGAKIYGSKSTGVRT
jgi:hypothetical protein